MNAFNNLFNRHCQNTLLARGWPADMELNYSLAYCGEMVWHFTACCMTKKYCPYWLVW